MELTIQDLKRQLNIELSFTDEDLLLQHMLDVSTSAVETYLGVHALTGYTGTTMPKEIIQAIVMLAAHFYINRNMVTFAQGIELPYSFKFLLSPYRYYIVG